MSIQDLPIPYQKILPRQLRKISIQETKATCFKCPWSQPKPNPSKWYRADLRCCTYEPFIPNFLVGFALKKGEEELKTYVRELIETAFALPIGIVPSPEFQIRFNERKVGDFGHREDLLCRHLDKSNFRCRVWPIRGSVCSTFFCESIYGKEGKQFWSLLKDQLSLVEMTLLEECLSRHGFSAREQNRSLEFLNMDKHSKISQRDRRGEKPNQKLAKLLWRDWREEKEKFYLLCYDWAVSIKRKEFLSLFPTEGKEIEKQLKHVVSQMRMTK